MECSPPSEENCNSFEYLEVLFDVNRGGFIDVAEKIISYLDYHSLIRFKQSCSLIYNFLKSTNLEQVKLRKKLGYDWRSGDHREYAINAPGLVSSARIFDNSSKVICGVDQQIVVSRIQDGARIWTLQGHNAVVNCVEYIEMNSKGYVVSGSQDGVLAFWSLESGEQVCSKTVFGRIEVVRGKGDILATAHFGRCFDVGVVSVRKANSPSDLPVIYSIYQDLFPIFSMDFNSSNLAAVEWSGTFNNVHAGNVLVYRWKETHPFVNLSDLIEFFSFTCCRFLDEEPVLVTGGHDNLVRIWDLADQANVKCLRTIRGHSNVIVRLELSFDLAASRDLDGNISIWDLRKAPSKIDSIANDITDGEDDSILVQKVKSVSRTVTCIAMDARKLLMGSIGQFCVYDYWNPDPEILEVGGGEK